MNVPLLDLRAQYASIRDEIRTAVDEVLESQYFILGPKVEELERAVAAYTGARFAVGVSSGTDALLASLMALDVGPGDEAVTTPFTFFSTAGAVSRLGARPVFVDIDPASFNMNPARLEKALTPKTKAVIPVHLFGQCADMDPILEVCRRRGVPVVEDAAQSIGADYKGRRAGAMGALGIFSFFPSKNLGAFGDGGMVVTSDAGLAERVRMLRTHGEHQRYFHREVGGNFRLDALQAAVLLVKLGHLDDWSAGRLRNARYYSGKLEESGLTAEGLITTPTMLYEKGGGRNHHIFNQYTLRVRKRDGLKAFLQERGVMTAVYYPVPLHLQECYKDLGYKKGDFPESEKAAGEVLSLPVYPELMDGQRDFVVAAITEFYKAR
ncbi:MAG: DegT/DnrJ/EryC1/StrS family aminotransferase [Candidatus Aminicenantes bacterium]|nr:DegT/DnrJ/EryC1/StrS family aminotransferase [Candidatus Aminicenantes bacterium]